MFFRSPREQKTVVHTPSAIGHFCQNEPLRIIARYGKWQGLSERQTIEWANRQRLTLLPNKDFERCLGEQFWSKRLLRDKLWGYEAWTGTLAAYEKPDEPVGKFITHKEKSGTIYVFEVPAKAIGAKNIALVVNHEIDKYGKPLIEYIDKGDHHVLVRVNDMSKVDTIEAFPKKCGWYLPDEKFGIPTGGLVGASYGRARRLVRLRDNYVGLIYHSYRIIPVSYSYLYRGFIYRNAEHSINYAAILKSVRVGTLAFDSSKGNLNTSSLVIERPFTYFIKERWKKADERFHLNKKWEKTLGILLNSPLGFITWPIIAIGYVAVYCVGVVAALAATIVLPIAAVADSLKVIIDGPVWAKIAVAGAWAAALFLLPKKNLPLERGPRVGNWEQYTDNRDRLFPDGRFPPSNF